MNRAHWFRTTLALAFALTGVTAFAQDKKPGDKPADKPAVKPADPKAADPKPAAPRPADPAAPKSADKAPAGEPDMKAMMEMMAKMSAPEKEHEALKPMAGSFNCITKITPGPGAPSTESTATVERKWLLGNRYLAEEVKSSMKLDPNAPAVPFEGFGITGYDKLQKFYHAYWIDTFGTGTWTMTGTADASGKTFNFTGENFDPRSMSKAKGRSTTEVISNDKHTMKMYDIGPDGKEFLGFEMTCTRK